MCACRCVEENPPLSELQAAPPAQMLNAGYLQRLDLNFKGFGWGEAKKNEPQSSSCLGLPRKGCSQRLEPWLKKLPCFVLKENRRGRGFPSPSRRSDHFRRETVILVGVSPFTHQSGLLFPACACLRPDHRTEKPSRVPFRSGCSAMGLKFGQVTCIGL